MKTDDLELERALRDLAAHVGLPGRRDLTAAVRRRIETSPIRRRWRPLWIWTRRSVALAVALVFVASAIGVASYFGVRGVEVRVTPTPIPGVGAGLDLGEPTTLAGARRAVEFPVLVPAALGPPDESYLQRGVPGSLVTLVYRPRPGLPRVPPTQAGLLLSEFQGRLDRAAMHKVASPSQIREVAVGTARALWVEGTHAVGYFGPDDQFVEQPLRTAGSVLLWEQGSTTLRLESALPLDAAIRIAESVG